VSDYRWILKYLDTIVLLLVNAGTGMRLTKANTEAMLLTASKAGSSKAGVTTASSTR
jgi:hypothetical protein